MRKTDIKIPKCECSGGTQNPHAILKASILSKNIVLQFYFTF